ncbi:G/U mismatch-specific uracil DNA glycosylase [Magnaporthiopsis poae ATCC 64411]|uniref:G/U mismatch-specific uracil DNA glycosylase n=1 Tax=Magnaporthiopsis poae (strain ATCC 64411 / 73-15) TaxID=644358 RepID=A0A0C4E524_MAGP6|nr:G/U mismatch-specific uracil DNA glycosylase [Magnaporthiopsis poae ATCC 64411]
MAAEPENEPLPTSPSRSPSFQGRLKLDDFEYRDGKQPTRRSARLRTPNGTRIAGSADGHEPTAASTPLDSPSAAGPSGRKRGRADDAAGDDGSESKDNKQLAPIFLKGAARDLAIISKRQKTRAAAPSDGGKKNGSGYAPPSTYAHLSGVQDALAPGLLVMRWRAANADDPGFVSSDLVDEGMEEVEGAADWGGARMFVATSTSGLAATLPLVEKERIWRELGVWVEQRRAERAAEAAAKA